MAAALWPDSSRAVTRTCWSEADRRLPPNEIESRERGLHPLDPGRRRDLVVRQGQDGDRNAQGPGRFQALPGQGLRCRDRDASQELR